MKVTLLLLLLSVVAMMSTCHLQLYKRGAGPGCPLGKRLVFDFKAMHDESKRLNNEYFDCPNPEPGVSCFYYSHVFHPFFVIEDTVVGESDRFLDSYTFKVVRGGRTRGSVRNYSQEEILKFISLNDSESSQQTLVWTYDDVPDSFLLTKEGFILTSGASNKVSYTFKVVGGGRTRGSVQNYSQEEILKFTSLSDSESSQQTLVWTYDDVPDSFLLTKEGFILMSGASNKVSYTFKVVRGGRTRGSVRNYSQEEILKFNSLSDSESSQQTLVWTYDDVPDSFLLTKEGFILMSGASNKTPKKQSVEDVLKMVLDGDSSDLEQFGEDDDDDDDDEDWTPTCTEGNSDSSDEEDLQDKSDDKTSGEVEDQTTIQDTTTK
ncbi:hypothetical protein AOLI_G00025960 [Acnodon oligacanthus]